MNRFVNISWTLSSTWHRSLRQHAMDYFANMPWILSSTYDTDPFCNMPWILSSKCHGSFRHAVDPFANMPCILLSICHGSLRQSSYGIDNVAPGYVANVLSSSSSSSHAMEHFTEFDNNSMISLINHELGIKDKTHLELQNYIYVPGTV